ncbi:MAG: lptD [Gammaproteobacteria bacterium]|jgi:LPS-assembly protein|nr:lptD [Gammaproteobacteria bacterium]
MRILNRFLSQLAILLGLPLWFTLSLAKTTATGEDTCLATNLPSQALVSSAIAKALGWIQTGENRCGGYYLESSFLEPHAVLEKNHIQLNSTQGIVFSLHGTSISEGQITITENGQQVIANKGCLYRDPHTGKINAVDLIGHVVLRQPNELVLADDGHVDLKTKTKSLHHILYRNAIYSKTSTSKPVMPSNEQIQHENKVYQLSAWGRAEKYEQNEHQISLFQQATYSTCPPLTNAWQVKASVIELNKNTGRGVAKNARLLVKGVPVFYTPYLNFPIDSRRQTGFLPPAIRPNTTESGTIISAPFYWNLAPNHDDTLTPSILFKRGIQITNLFRYLTPETEGKIKIAVLPHDQLFSALKEKNISAFEAPSTAQTQAQFNRLENASTTRKALTWQNNMRFDEHWTSNLDYNYVSDDYYTTNFNNGLTQVTTNHLLQQADLIYKGQFWQFRGNIQGYQTLHPLNQSPYFNEYTRFPQLILSGDYLDENTGLNYSIDNDVSHFIIRKNPGADILQPYGTRFTIQPAISWPEYRPAFFFNPRLQFAMTQYEVSQIPTDNQTTTNANLQSPHRVLPIFDITSGMYFERHFNLLQYDLIQTLEPQFYYTYIPYRNQNNLPVFDTTLNVLTYDQLFTYNRFSGLDRIGDANQLALGLATRFMDQRSGTQKAYAGIGQIAYFRNRLVTLCSNDDPTQNCSALIDPNNRTTRSPLSGVLSYNLTPHWTFTSNTIYDTHVNNVTNETLTLSYSTDSQRSISLSYTYALNEPNIIGSSANNLSQTDLNFIWPITHNWSTLGRWTENFNTSRFQNLLFGLQYDSCCWAVRFLVGRTFTNVTLNNTFNYNTESYIQFALKGLGNFGTGDPNPTLNSGAISYQTNFGQDF